MLGRNSGFVARSFARIFCNDGLSCNCFCIGMLKMQGYYLCNIQVENRIVVPIMGYCFKYFTCNHVFHYYFFELSKFFCWFREL